MTIIGIEHEDCVREVMGGGLGITGFCQEEGGRGRGGKGGREVGEG